MGFAVRSCLASSGLAINLDRLLVDLVLRDHPLLLEGGGAPFLESGKREDRIDIGPRLRVDGDRIGLEARRERGEHRVGGAEGPEQERPALPEALARLAYDLRKARHFA